MIFFIQMKKPVITRTNFCFNINSLDENQQKMYLNYCIQIEMTHFDCQFLRVEENYFLYTAFYF